MSVKNYVCPEKCCNIYIRPYSGKSSSTYKGRLKKAGIFVFDPKEKRVLLVQSKGSLFGPPKGTLEPDETVIDGAIRELKEETGIVVDFAMVSVLPKYYLNKGTFFYLEMKSFPIDMKNVTKDNDVNGITWIKLECLEHFIKEQTIYLNSYAKFLFLKILGKNFMRSL